MTRSDLSRSYSVVVPVYNSAPVLDELVSRLGEVLAAISDGYEVILVNDGSRDESWEQIRALAGRYHWVRGINLLRNFGQHNALLCGIRAAQHPVTVTLDDDLQNPPEEIPKLIRKLSEGHDVVYGVPLKEQHGLWRDIASRITKIALQRTTGVAAARNVSSFRAFRTQLRDASRNFSGPFVSIDVLLTWGTSRFAAVKVQHVPGERGESNYTFVKLITHALNMLTGFTVWPLRVATFIGFGIALFGVGVQVFVIGRYFLNGSTVPGFSFLASLIATFSGAQLCALGIMGEYLARMHFRLMERPTYVASEYVGTLGKRTADAS